MRTRHLLIIALACGAGGYGLAQLLAPVPETPAASALPAVAEPWFDPALPVEARLRELERAVSEERQARQLLEEELLVLRDLVEARPADTGRSLAGAGPAAAVVNEVRARRDRDADDASRAARFEAAGFTPERAAWIAAREAELQFEMLQARHDAERSGNYGGYRELMMNRDAAFRDEIGEADFERYLEATGRSTAIAVGSVMDASPAQAAGLRPGDEIVRYAGQRVYDIGDLNRLTLEGRAGETVYVEVLRDGMPMQLALPRGPVGITSGGGRRRQ